MNDDTWYTVFKFVKYTKDALSIKNVCKSANNGFCLYVKNTMKTYPRRTFIKMNTCMTCESTGDKINVIHYPDCYPPRLLYYCNKFSCFSSCLNSFFVSLEKEKIYPFIEEKSEQFYVTRTDGKYSQGKIKEKKLYIKDSAVFCSVIFQEEKHIKKKYPIYNVNPNNFNFHKLVSVNDVDVNVPKLFWNMWSSEIKNAINTQLDDTPYIL